MNEKLIHDFLKSKGLNEYGVAGLMGNLFAESALNPLNLQNSFEKKLGMSDADYARKVDTGVYKNFVHDKAGFGLAQWTYWNRKQNLLDFSRQTNRSIGDIHMQLDFLWKELSEHYTGVCDVLFTATSVLQASNAVLLNFERPADQSTEVQAKRAGYAQGFYDRFAVLPESEEDLDAIQFKELFEEMRRELQDNDCGTWSGDARDWAVSTGLIKGNGATANGEPNCMWRDFVTREQFVAVLLRFSKLLGSAER